MRMRSLPPARRSAESLTRTVGETSRTRAGVVHDWPGAGLRVVVTGAVGRLVHCSPAMKASTV